MNKKTDVHMKKIVSLLVLVLALNMTANAQLISMIKKAIPHYAHGTVTYKDGHEETYLWVELPKHGTTTLKVSDDPKHKKTTGIPAAEVAYITVWTEKLPEKKMELYYIHADKSKLPLCGMIATDAWGYPIAGNSWGTVYKCNPRYEEDKKSGEIMFLYDIRTVQNGNLVRTEEVAAPCYMVCPDYENAQLIGGSGSYSGNSMSWAALPKRIAPMFHSNPSIEKRILNNELKGQDIQFILDEMAIHQGISDKQEIAPATEEKQPLNESTQSTTYTENGSVGDDE